MQRLPLCSKNKKLLRQQLRHQLTRKLRKVRRVKQVRRVRKVRRMRRMVRRMSRHPNLNRKLLRGHQVRPREVPTPPSYLRKLIATGKKKAMVRRSSKRRQKKLMLKLQLSGPVKMVGSPRKKTRR